ncbi:MAG: hypothetical protein Kow0077_01710 [Anaerolineae bacterium]
MIAPGDARSEETVWPFSRSVLLAGLRRYLVAPRLRLVDLQPIPLPDDLPGRGAEGSSELRSLAVKVDIDGDVRHLALVLKYPPVSEKGRVLSAVGQREYGIYRRLAPHLPVLVPGLVAGDPDEGWIVVEALAALRPMAEWTRTDYEEALTNLAVLHDRFWGLGEDLAIFPWLARPLDTDYRATVMAAASALQKLIQEESLPVLVSPRNFRAFATLVQQADEIARVLREETHTLLHGDYWPGNIGCPAGGRQIIYDWQRASIGPAILDLQVFVLTSAVLLDPPLTASEMIAFYRREMAARLETGWDDARFALIWDYGLMWQFLAYWLRRLAAMTPEVYAEHLAPRFEAVWLQPVLDALARRL